MALRDVPAVHWSIHVILISYLSISSRSPSFVLHASSIENNREYGL